MQKYAKAEIKVYAIRRKKHLIALSMLHGRDWDYNPLVINMNIAPKHAVASGPAEKQARLE